MVYLAVNSIFVIIAIVGCFLIDKLDEGFFMGINGFIKMFFLIDLGVVAIAVNLAMLIMSVLA